MADAVATGLGSSPKSLPSWLFYDETGDMIFQQIMRMPEYYPTRCEYDILQQHKDAILNHFQGRDPSPFNIVELGAGDGLKTEILLRHFLSRQVAFTYIPIDISGNALEQLRGRLSRQLPGLQITPLNTSYDEALASLRNTDEKKVVLFMGANIGNFSTADAMQFLKKLVRYLSPDDMLLVGFDLKKNPRVIQEAYDDPRHLTASFNLNILVRINRELGGSFNLDYFIHFPSYDPATGATKSFLISMKDQSVHIDALGKTIHFGLWEPVHTEVSQKYDVPMIEKLMAVTGFKIIDLFYDADKYFCDVLVAPG